MIQLTNLKDIISPAFYDICNDILDEKHTHYIEAGGRGSMKSSFFSIMIILGIMMDESANALILRQTANTLVDSVFAQLQWAIDMLGVSEYWETRKSPLKLIYKPTRQEILFRGADVPSKLRSIKPPKGYLKYLWFEELQEFMGMDVVRNISISAMRGGHKFNIFYSFNPPKSVNSWVNQEILIHRPDRVVHHSNYLQSPAEWLGEQFIIEADMLKETNLLAYQHEYLGLATGTGGLIFDNLEIRPITEQEKNNNQYKFYGIDWGFAVDPASFGECLYDAKNRILYLTDEIHGIRMTNKVLADKIIEKGYKGAFIYADSAEPKSIYDLYDYGLNVQGVKKWNGSDKNGIEWLQSLKKIVIDNKKCPNTAREFSTYEFSMDKYGNYISQYPDKDNHTIDRVRYAMVEQILQRKESRLK